MQKSRKSFLVAAFILAGLALVGSVFTFAFLKVRRQKDLQQEIAVEIRREMEPYTQLEEYTTETIVLTQEDVQHLAQAVLPLITMEITDDTTGATRKWTEEKIAALEDEIASGVAGVITGNLVYDRNDPGKVSYAEKLQGALTKNITMIVENVLLSHLPEGQEESLDYLLLSDALEQNRISFTAEQENSLKEIQKLRENLNLLEQNLKNVDEDSASLEEVGDLTKQYTYLSEQYTTLVNEYAVYKNQALVKEDQQKEEIKQTGKQLEEVMDQLEKSLQTLQRATDKKLEELGEDVTDIREYIEDLRLDLDQTGETLSQTMNSLAQTDERLSLTTENLGKLQEAVEQNYLNRQQLSETYYSREEVDSQFLSREEAGAQLYTKEEVDAMFGATYDPEGIYVTGDIILREGKMYECLVDMEGPEEWNPEHWQIVTMTELLSSGAGSESYREMILVALSASGLGLNEDSDWDEIAAALTRWFPSKYDLLSGGGWITTASTRGCFGTSVTNPTTYNHRLEAMLAGNGDDFPYIVGGSKRTIYDRKIGFGGFSNLRLKGYFNVNDNNLSHPEVLTFSIFERPDLSSPALAGLTGYTLNGGVATQRGVTFDCNINLTNITAQGYIGFTQDVFSYGAYTNSTVVITEMYLE